MNVPFLQTATFTGLVSTDEYYTSQEWKEAYDIATFYSQNSAILVEQTTFRELTSLKANNQLKPGQYYQINDFQLMWWNLNLTDNTILSSDTIEPLLVLALSTNNISQQAYSVLHPSDIVYYDIDARTSATWNVGPYDIPNFKGWIYRRVNLPKNIDIPWDWRYITHNCCKYDLNAISTYNSGTTYSRNAVVYNSARTLIYISVQNNNINNPVTSSSWWRSLGFIQDYYPTSEGSSNFLEAVAGLVPLSSTRGQFYTFTNNLTVPKNRINVEDYFNIYNIVIDQGEEQRQGNTIFNVGNNIQRFFQDIRIKFNCLNNLFSGNASYNIVCGADFFGNIFTSFFTNSVVGDGFQSNFFNSFQLSNSTISNNFRQNYASRIGLGGILTLCKIGETCQNNFFGGGSFRNNNIDENFSRNSTGALFSYNNINFNCTDNIFETGFSYNKLGSFVQNNSIGTNFTYNTLGNSCTNNTIGNFCNFNNIQNEFSYNTIGTDFQGNNLNNYFTNNSVGNIFQFNSIGNDFQNNTTGLNFIRTNIGNEIQSIDFTGATHVYNSYDKNIFKNFDSIARLSYFNSNDQLVITDPTA